MEMYCMMEIVRVRGAEGANIQIQQQQERTGVRAGTTYECVNVSIAQTDRT